MFYILLQNKAIDSKDNLVDSMFEMNMDPIAETMTMMTRKLFDNFHDNHDHNWYYLIFHFEYPLEYEEFYKYEIQAMNYRLNKQNISIE